MAESKEELKSLLMKLKEETEKVGLKLNFRKQRSWQIDGETIETFTYFFFFLAESGGRAPKSLQMVTAAMKLKDACSLVEKL